MKYSYREIKVEQFSNSHLSQRFSHLKLDFDHHHSKIPNKTLSAKKSRILLKDASYINLKFFF